MRIEIRYKGTTGRYARMGAAYDAYESDPDIETVAFGGTKKYGRLHLKMDDRKVSINPGSAKEARQLAYALLSLAEELE